MDWGSNVLPVGQLIEHKAVSNNRPASSISLETIRQIKFQALH